MTAASDVDHYTISGAVARVLCAQAEVWVAFVAIFWIQEEAILRAVFGLKLGAAIAPLLLLLGMQAINAAFGFSRSLLDTLDRQRSTLPTSTTAVLINACLCFFLIPLAGVSGVARSSLISLAIWNLALYLKALNADTINYRIPVFAKLKNAC